MVISRSGISVADVASTKKFKRSAGLILGFAEPRVCRPEHPRATHPRLVAKSRKTYPLPDERGCQIHHFTWKERESEVGLNMSEDDKPS